MRLKRDNTGQFWSFWRHFLSFLSLLWWPCATDFASNSTHHWTQYSGTLKFWAHPLPRGLNKPQRPISEVLQRHIFGWFFLFPGSPLLAWSFFLLPNGTQYQAKYSQVYLMMNPPLWRVKGAPRGSLTIFKVCIDFQLLSGGFYQAADIRVW